MYAASKPPCEPIRKKVVWLLQRFVSNLTTFFLLKDRTLRMAMLASVGQLAEQFALIHPGYRLP